MTLLGQNVNTYGLGLHQKPGSSPEDLFQKWEKNPDVGEFAKLLESAAKTPGIQRLRFMSPHPQGALLNLLKL